MSIDPPGRVSRRDILAGAVTLGTAALLPQVTSAAPARYRRWNVSDPNCPPRVLASYKKAIRAMLALPPTDPRNWYRYTLIHTVDCPHGNWWFLPWHRGYTGWFEQICRELSGDPEFALPYWDWTKEPRIPTAMFDDVLDPNNSAFVAAAADFKAQYKDVIAQASYWATTRNPDGSIAPSPQYNQLLNRSIRFPEDLWFDIIDYPGGGMFFDRGHARGLSAAQPDLTIPNTPPEKQSVLIAVSLPTILDALAPRDFLSFASPKALTHSAGSGFGVLESQPHNLVHNCVGGAYNGVGGFMQAFMSPTDPIFYLHHTNIDRLWDVWTRKQMARNAPILPDGYPQSADQQPTPGSDYVKWAREPFLFFVDAQGNPAQQSTAGSYASIGAFDYDYSPGSGEEVVPVTPQPPVVTSLVSLPAALTIRQVDGKTIADASVAVPLDVINKESEPNQPKLFASITVDLPDSHEDLDVFIKGPDGKTQFVAMLSMFGRHRLSAPVTFQVPLSASLAALQADRKFETSPALNVQIIPRVAGARHVAMSAPTGAAGQGGVAEVSAVSLQQL